MVLQDGLGIDDALRAQADWLAGAGYLAPVGGLGLLGAAVSVPAEVVP
jgi:hypothetical protein